MDTQTHRLRTRRACEACKARKRKCDGQDPCTSCVRYEYSCLYRTRLPRKRAKEESESAASYSLQSSQSPALLRPPTSSPSHFNTTPTNAPAAPTQAQRHVDCSSGMAFPHVLGLKLDPGHPPQLKGFGWNLGLQYHQPRSEKSITWIITHREWDRLFEIYVDNIHPLYGFLDTESIFAQSLTRWINPNATKSYDHILCGIAAIASLFLPPHERLVERERLLVECAREMMEINSMIREPTYIDAQAWLLRTLFLRFSSPPHATWMASCTTMHVVEATGLHLDPSTNATAATADNDDVESASATNTARLGPEVHRRVYWAAKLLNSWISFEFGRSRVVIQGSTCQPPATMTQDPSSDMVKMFQFSEYLHSDSTASLEQLETGLREIGGYDFNIEHLIMSQANVCFGFYRRLRVSNVHLNTDLLKVVIEIGTKALAASRQVCEQGRPWWHTSNVPFQFTCVLLAMDTSESLSKVNESLDTLRFVASTFNTPMARSALETIESLVRLAQKKKEQDAMQLSRSLMPLPAVATSTPKTANSSTYPSSTDLSQGQMQNQNQSQNQSQVQTQSSLDQVTDFSWSNGLLLNDPTLDDINWDMLFSMPLGLSNEQLPV
ncbi:hypothetical protein B0A52_02216 [Exophiala mesophila]|uniref:Zn(2)-C6 fungal-type domain-containing protein n=1 Tax=Exophiala mesophila TaxID=212818 RepID=A0A438NBQ8_EXOME|nr:hypothetical protein B0A52_02216 [Exophiala mesophila]